MRVITCLTEEHNYLLVLLAAVMCIAGSLVTIRLFRRALETKGLPRHGWNFLTAVCAGASIWSTHFIAMLGYTSKAVFTFDPVLTILSIIIAILGTGIGFAVGSRLPGLAGTLLGGGLIGLAVSAMHYTGMFAYRVGGVVSWDAAYIVVSIGLAIGFATAAVAATRRWQAGPWRHLPTALLVAAIVGLHFTGMAAFQVSPTPGFEFAGPAAGTIEAMALSVMTVGLIVVGTGFSSYLIDGRLRAVSKEQLRQLAFRDPLTGLANRRAFQIRIEEDLRAGKSFWLLLVNLDRLKRVNDTYGNAAGDTLLVKVAARLLSAAGPDAFVARIDGDELAVLAPVGDAAARRIADEIVRLIAEPFELDDQIVFIGCSVGLCPSEEADSADALMQRTEFVVRKAKSRGRNGALCYEPGMIEAAAELLGLETDLKVALEQRQLRLLYQPIMDLKSSRIIGYEALIRWHHPARGMVPPADFIPMAEESGLIVQIGAWVLEEACREASTWGDGLFVAVNVSAVQFRSPLLFAHCTHALAASGLPPARLEIELTETAIVTDERHVAAVLAALRVLGVKVAMDDFGTGYSSLAHLRDLPLDRIKIDRSFVATAEADSNSMAVVRAITQLGRDMGIATLGEGVETLGQMQLLRTLGCDAAQGYLIGKPMRAADIAATDMAARA